MVKKTSTKQSYAEFLEQKESANRIIEEYLETNRFRELHQKLVKEYHDSEEFRKRVFALTIEHQEDEKFRNKIFALVDENSTNWLGKLTKKSTIIIATALISSICTLAASFIFSKILFSSDATNHDRPKLAQSEIIPIP